MRAVNARRPVVMVVDDDDGIHAALRLVLEDDFELLSVSSGEAAIRCLAEYRIDLMLLDLLMPDVDGWQVFEHARAMKGHRPRIVFLTAIDSSQAAVAALKLGADDWILKPFEDAALLARLQTLLSETRTIRIRGGDLGARATIAALAFIRCGALAVYQPDHALPADEPFIDAAAATTLDGLRTALCLPPIRLPAFHRVTGTALHHVSRQYQKVNVAALAEMVGVNGNYLLARFRDDLGLTPREYIARVRIEVVKQRLGQMGCPSLDRLAEEVGLYDGAHVHKIFARYAHGSPGAYRGNVQDRW
jgi:DNA-binding response OmpR family regulator/methylphosphotriester-DNA--protein-cysteine methyltransferase